MGNTIKFKRIYELKEELGKGSFATVKRAIHKKTGDVYAVKIIRKQELQPEELRAINDEVKIMSAIKHDHCVGLYDMFESPRKVYMVLELLDGGELFDRIVQENSFTEGAAAELTRCLADAIGYLHSRGIVHRDLKPENIIYKSKAKDAEVKITDFGLAKIRKHEEKMLTACGTPGYVAPEVLKQQPYTSKVDIWSLGVILYILLCGYPPFYNEEGNTVALYDQIKQGDFEFKKKYWGGISDNAKDLVRRMLTVDPNKRIDTEGILRHPWIVDKGSHSTTAFSGDYNTRLQLLQARSRLRKTVKKIIAINKFAAAVQVVLKQRKESEAKKT